jgi:hypothetical protein
MKDWSLVIAGVLAAGLLLVVLPVGVSTFLRMRRGRSVVCPKTGEVAGIRLDAWRAAGGSLVDRSALKVSGCTLWPWKEGCAQNCLKNLESS